MALKRYLNEMPGRIQDTIWTDIAPVNSQAKERTGYPTQKPLALLERIIKASSNEGDMVLDPFCGCATACIAAERLGRQWVGIDSRGVAAFGAAAALSDRPGKFGNPPLQPLNHPLLFQNGGLQLGNDGDEEIAVGGGQVTLSIHSLYMT